MEERFYSDKAKMYMFAVPFCCKGYRVLTFIEDQQDVFGAMLLASITEAVISPVVVDPEVALKLKQYGCYPILSSGTDIGLSGFDVLIWDSTHPNRIVDNGITGFTGCRISISEALDSDPVDGVFEVLLDSNGKSIVVSGGSDES